MPLPHDPAVDKTIKSGHAVTFMADLKLRVVLLLACFGLTSAAMAQSSRPGWGSVPYHDAFGTGVTFRVWAPNATSVYVPGVFNGWSTTTTPLAKEFVNGSWTGIWSADVTSASSG